MEEVPVYNSSMNDKIVDAVNAVLPPSGVFVGVWSLGYPVEGNEDAVRFQGFSVVANTAEEGVIQALLNQAASAVNSSSRESKN